MLSEPMKQPLKRKRPIWFYLTAIGIGLVGALLVAEVGLRIVLSLTLRSSMDDSPANTPKDGQHVGFGQLVYRVPDSLTIYRLKPNMRATMGTAIRTNALGFRDDEVVVPKPPKTFRIIFLGDSTMFGWLIEKQNAFAEMIEDDLQEAAGPDWKIECINTAVPAYNTAQEVAMFHESCLALQPDAVVIQYELNDELILPYAIEPPFFGFGFYLGRLPDYWRGKYKSMDDLVMAIQGERLFKKYPDSHGWNSIVNSYRKLVQTCRERGLPLVVLMPPIPPEVNAPDKIDDPRFKPFRELCNELDITPVEIFKTVQTYAIEKNLKGTEVINSIQDNHANELGHALIAQAALPSIEHALLPRIIGEDHPLARRAPDSNRALRYTTGHGFYNTEDWGGAAVNWTKLEAGVDFDPLGRTLKLKYCVKHKDISPETPVTVSVTIRQADPSVESVPEGTGFRETIRRHMFTKTYTHTAKDFYKQEIDLSGFEPGRLRLEIEVNRVCAFPPDPRHMGIGLYPLTFEP